MHGETSIRIELTDFLLDILGDGFIPAMAMDGEITKEALRKKRERMHSEIEGELNTIHILIQNIADKIVLLRGPGEKITPNQQKFCYQISATIHRDNGTKDVHNFYSETYWNSWVLITTLLNTMNHVGIKILNSKLVDRNEIILFYIKEVLKTTHCYHGCKSLNLDIKEYFTAFEDVLKNRKMNENFFKYPFYAFNDYLKNTDYKLESFFELWENIKQEAVDDFRYRDIKRRRWNTICPLLYDPDYLLYEKKNKNKILNLFDIQVEFTTQEETKYYFVKETESTKKNFELKQQYRLFQARLFVAYLLNNMYAAMKEKGFNTEQIEEMFDDIHHYALQNPTGE